MEQLIRFLLQNPIWLFVLLAWVLPAVGTLLRRAATRAAERNRQMQQRQQHDQAHADRSGRMPAEVEAPARSAEDIAREIRRMLGVEPEPRAEPEPQPQPAPAPASRQEQRRHPAPRSAHERATAPRELAPASVRQPVPAAPLEPIWAAARKKVQFRITNPREAVLLAEVFGPPLAMRPSSTLL